MVCEFSLTNGLKDQNATPCDPVPLPFGKGLEYLKNNSFCTMFSDYWQNDKKPVF